MNTIDYTLEASDIWLQTLHSTTPSTLNNNKLELLPELGTGTLQTLKIQNGLYVTMTDVILNQPIVLNRQAKSTNDGFILNIYLSNSQVETNINGDKIDLGINKNKVVLSSSSSTAKLIFPNQMPIKVFHIYLSRSWILKNAISEESAFYEPVTTDKPIYIIENLDHNFSKVKELIIPSIKTLNKIKLRSIVFQVLEHLIAQLEKRANPVFMPLKPVELSNLMSSVQTIESRIPDVISNEQLAKQSSMSLSKFKTLFKQVYGISPYQYHLQQKMNLAFELLKSNKYSVSEVGFLIGYKNLGQFSKRFYKEHNILPSEVKQFRF